jgi:hypothetical protein
LAFTESRIVTLDGVEIKPGLALGGWTVFKPAHDGAMVMGDVVLLGSEINPLISKLQAGGLEVTAIHNHLELLRLHLSLTRECVLRIVGEASLPG